MDRRERLSDSTVAFITALEGHQAGIWTALPGIVNSFDASRMTCTVKPAIQARVVGQKGEITWVSLPLLVDVPVVFQSAGGYSITFPVKPGDEALVVFSSRCIDAWWDTASVGIQTDLRLHDLSDGFALIGPRSRPRALSPAVNAGGLEIRNDARSTYVRIADSGNLEAVTAADATVTAAGTMTLTASAVVINGPVTVNGSVTATGDVTGAGIHLASHIHSGVTTGGGVTAGPT